MAKSKKPEVVVPEAPSEVSFTTELPSYSVVLTGITYPSAPCVVCGSAVAPGQVCAVDGHTAE